MNPHSIPLEGDVESYLIDQRTLFRKIYEDEGADGAFRMLSVGPHIIPDVAAVQAHEEKMHNEGIGTFLRSAVQSHAVSIDHRIVDHAQPGSDQDRRTFLQSYGIRVNGYAILAMTAFAQELVLSDDVTIDDCMSFFSKTWFTRSENEKTIPDTFLIDLLRPSLRAWFETTRGESNVDELITAIDSMVPKLETILRKFARLSGVLDTKTVERSGVLVDEHRGLEIVEEARIRDSLGADLYEFITYVLDRTGEGFRDRLAHGAVYPGEYTFEQSDLIVLILLRIAGRSPSPPSKHESNYVRNMPHTSDEDTTPPPPKPPL